MPFGDASFSQAPLSSLGQRDSVIRQLSGAASGTSAASAVATLIHYKTLIAIGRRGNRSTLNISGKGNFTEVVRISDNRIEVTIVQKGNVRISSIEDPNGIESYELVETID